MSKMSKIAEQTIESAELSELTRLTARQLRRRIEQGIISPAKGGKYPLLETVRLLLAHEAGRVAANSASHQAEKARLIQARVGKLTLETQQLRAQYVPRSEISPILLNLAANQAACLTRILVSEAPSQLAYKDPIALREIMVTAMDRICDEFQSRTISLEWLSPPPSTPPTQKSL